METGMIVAIIGALGLGTILAKLSENIWAWVTGKTAREQTAWAQRDREAKARRQLEEYASTLRLRLISLGEEPPDWPIYKTQP